MASMIGNIEPFSGDKDDWDVYTSRVGQFLLLNAINDPGKRRAALLTSMGNSTYKLLKSLVAPTDPDSLDFQVIVDTLRNHFQPKRLAIAERFKFHRRNQQSGETISMFVSELRRLAQYCEFGSNLDDSLRDRFVCGMKSEQAQRRLLSEDKLTLVKAIQIAESMEAAESNVKHFHGEMVEVNALRNTRKNFGKSPAQRKNQKQSNFNSSQSKSPKTPCPHCANTGHWGNDCYFKDSKCHLCGEIGHILPACRSKSKSNGNKNKFNNSAKKVTNNVQISDDGDDDSPSYKIGWTSTTNSISATNESIQIDTKLNGRDHVMELDTGSAVSIVSDNIWRNTLHKCALSPTNVKLTSYSGHQLSVKGQAMVKVSVNNQCKELPLLVVKNVGVSLFGRDWLQQLILDWPSLLRNNLNYKSMATNSTVHATNSSAQAHNQKLQHLLAKFNDLFAPGLGKIKDVKAHLHMKPEAVPRFFKARVVPYALKEGIEATLDRLQSMGVIDPIPYSDWAAPIVPDIKPNGTVRVCADLKVTINPFLDVNKYPLPTPEDLFSQLQRHSGYFTALDLSDGYHQLELDEHSKRFCVINTHKGLFRYNRLLFGANSAPSIFQQTMDTVLQGLEGVICYLDDILVCGKTIEEHLFNLEAVFERLRNFGVRLRLQKCKFLQESVKYLGHYIDRNGLHTDPEKIRAIQDAPSPTNVSELRAFLGTVTYYCKFIPQLSDIAAPLNNLLRNDFEFKWSTACAKSFKQLKSILTSSDVLCHYDPKLPLSLACDASSKGLGAMIFHTMQNGDERPIAYASRTLTKAEAKYSQIQREALAIIFGLKKFHKFLYGRKFQLITDHKPLITIFGPTTAFPAMAANRLQRWAIILSAYNNEIKFKPTKQHCNVDGLSRLPVSAASDDVVSDDALIVKHIMKIFDEQIEIMPVTSSDISLHTRRDPILSQVLTCLKLGWPNLNKISAEIKPFYVREKELLIHNDCLFWGLRCIVPEKFRQRILNDLHVAHSGVVRTKALARAHVWWPNIDHDIEQMIRNCTACNQHRDAPAETPLHPWEFPSRVWQRVHLDFAGPFLGSMWLIVVDARSKWPEIVRMSTTTAPQVIRHLRSIFSRFGCPEQIVSDNGPQFISEEYGKFCKMNGIKRVLVSPYHARSNGAAERNVKTFKQAFVSMATEPDLDKRLDSFLFNYRITPHTSTGISPAEIMFGRQLRNRFDLLRFSPDNNAHRAQYRQKVDHDRFARYREFHVGQRVWAMNFHPKDVEKWLPGTIVDQKGPVSFLVDISGSFYRRHIDQLLDRETDTPPELQQMPELSIPHMPNQLPNFTPTTTSANLEKSPTVPTVELPTSYSATQSAVDSPPPTSADQQASSLRRSARPRKPPKRFGIEE